MTSSDQLPSTICEAVRAQWQELRDQRQIENDLRSVSIGARNGINAKLIQAYKAVYRQTKIGRRLLDYMELAGVLSYEIIRNVIVPLTHTVTMCFVNTDKQFTSSGPRLKPCKLQVFEDAVAYLTKLAENSGNVPVELATLVACFKTIKGSKPFQAMNSLMQKCPGSIQIRQNFQPSRFEYEVKADLGNGIVFSESTTHITVRHPVRRCKQNIIIELRKYIAQFEKEEMERERKRNELFRYRVIAAYVVTDEVGEKKPQVVSIGTGTKLIASDVITTQDMLLDSHAEIIARRAFKRFLLEELNNGHYSQFLDSLDNGQRYRWKSSKRLHLFVNCPPCGAAQKKADTVNCRALRLIQSGTQAETPMVSPNAIRQRSHFYTCSDKIALCNLVGVQGALLSAFMDPIYLNSVIVYSPWSWYMTVNEADLRQALCERIQPLPREIRIYLNNDFSHTAYVLSDASTLCHNWVYNLDLELTDGRNGYIHQLEDPSGQCPSRLSKNSLHKQFQDVFQRLGVTKLENMPNYVNPNDILKLSYSDLKSRVVSYQKAKQKAKETFERKQLGFWRPRENRIN